jgi:3-oxoacyl-[acyl-carrier-protein] synthase II
VNDQLEDDMMRVVVTGMGAVTGFGYGVQALSDGLFSQQSSVRENSLFAELNGESSAVAFVEDVPNEVVCRADHFIRAAIREAVDQAKLPVPVPALEVFVASLHGNVDVWCRARGTGRPASPDLWELGADLWPQLAVQYNVTTISTACTASSLATGRCLDYLRSGVASVGIVAATEGLTPFLLEGFKSFRSLAAGNCQPFDANRDGLVVGEGAAVLVLETLEHAERRNAVPLAELAGYGLSTDGTSFTSPDPAGRGASRALSEALRDAGLTRLPDSINTHGTGTKLNDRMECIALRRTFGDDVRNIPITSCKPAIGHMFGAAGAIELVCSVLSMRRDEIPPILTLEEPDPQLGQLDFVYGRPRLRRQDTIISMNSAFGGTNSAVVLRRLSS